MTTDPPVEQALLPCPFCGQQDNDIVDDRWMCNCCMAEGPPSRVNPDAAWNRRATRPQPDREAIARVIEECAKIAEGWPDHGISKQSLWKLATAIRALEPKP